MKRLGVIAIAAVLVPCFAVFAFSQDLFAQSLGGASYASALMRPFGGRLVGTYPCTCTGGAVSYLVFMTAKGPETLTYTLGTQAYKSHNLPYGIVGGNALGFYNGAVTQACLMYAGTTCFVLPSKGMITPVVGSSLK